MKGQRLLSLLALLALFGACGSRSAQVAAGGSLPAGETDPAAEPAPGVGGTGTEPEPRGHALAPSKEAPSAPLYDPNVIREVLDLSAPPPADERQRLGLRLVLFQQGPDLPWVVSVVNRGTRSLEVVFDLRTLSLEITPPSEPEPEGKRAVRRQAPKPIRCELPKDVVPSVEARNFELVLEPGEGVIDAFDPRLYCLPSDGVSRLVPGSTVIARLGWPEKTKAIWRAGKREQQILEQTPPFVARVQPEPSAAQEPQKAPSSQEKTAPDGELTFERTAVKQLLAPSVFLGPEYSPEPPDSSKGPPIALLLSKGSDARTEREATVTVSLLNRSSRSQSLYFRRELLSFELSGPSGLVACNPGPDVRAPDRQSFASLAPGRRVTATSRLIELCPVGALRVPGLYLVHARFDASHGGEAFGLRAFQGRVVSEKPALIRVRKGWAPLAGQREPLRIRVGQTPEDAGPPGALNPTAE